MFPVLAVLCAHAKGTSRIYGAPHLKQKESNRIESVSALLKSMSVQFEPLDDGIIIYGKGRTVSKAEVSIARSYSDHRLVMAAAVAKRFGHNLTVDHPEEVRKSFPEFYQIGAEQW